MMKYIYSLLAICLLFSCSNDDAIPETVAPPISILKTISSPSYNDDYNFNAQGLPLQLNETFGTQYSYNDDGQLISKEEFGIDAYSKLDYNYDQNGKLTSMDQYATGIGYDHNRVIEIVYDGPKIIRKCILCLI